MLFNSKNLAQLAGQIFKKCGFQNGSQDKKLLNVLGCDLYCKNQKKNFHLSMPRIKNISSGHFYKRAAVSDAKTQDRVKQTFIEDITKKRNEGYFPTVDLPNTLFGNVPFKDLPYVKVIATRNNTKLSLVDNGANLIRRSGGSEGFKNSRKGTNVAAQTVGSAFGLRAIKRGYKNIRVIVSGLGAGRLSAIKGLQLSGMNIVSITDNTVYQRNGRPRKQRRI